MVLEFTNTLEDYVEANRAHAAVPASVSKGRRVRGLIGWVLFISLAIMLFILMQRRPTAAPAPVPAPAPAAGNSFARVLLPIVPWALIFGFIWFFVFRQMRMMQRQTKRASALYEPGKEPRAQKSGGLLALLSGLGNYKVMWESQPQLHRPQSVEVREDGVVIADAVTRAENRWDAFSHVIETANLFLLYTSDYAFHMVPKRAFASEKELRSFRELVRRHIAERPAPAFPVIPVRQA